MATQVNCNNGFNGNNGNFINRFNFNYRFMLTLLAIAVFVSNAATIFKLVPEVAAAASIGSSIKDYISLGVLLSFIPLTLIAFAYCLLGIFDAFQRLVLKVDIYKSDNHESIKRFSSLFFEHAYYVRNSLTLPLLIISLSSFTFLADFLVYIPTIITHVIKYQSLSQLPSTAPILKSVLYFMGIIAMSTLFLIDSYYHYIKKVDFFNAEFLSYEPAAQDTMNP